MDDYLIDRALKAYFKAGKRSGYDPDQPSSTGQDVVTHYDREYVVLANSVRLLAVYKIRRNGKPRLLDEDEWPKAVVKGLDPQAPPPRAARERWASSL